MTEQAHTTHPNYVKIWGILVFLLIISVCGPMLGIKVVTLITAFGIALVKAYLVAKNFMHLNIERRYVTYLLLTMIGFMLIFFFGVSPDVMKHEGQNWTNVAAKEAVKKGLEQGGGHHGGEHGGSGGGSAGHGGH